MAPLPGRLPCAALCNALYVLDRCRHSLSGPPASACGLPHCLPHTTAHQPGLSGWLSSTALFACGCPALSSWCPACREVLPIRACPIDWSITSPLQLNNTFLGQSHSPQEGNICFSAPRAHARTWPAGATVTHERASCCGVTDCCHLQPSYRLIALQPWWSGHLQPLLAPAASSAAHAAGRLGRGGQWGASCPSAPSWAGSSMPGIK